ncbi:endonuclease VII [Vibrio phage D479]
MPKQLRQSQMTEVRNELTMNQLGKCLLCDTPLSQEKRTPHVDHDHQFGNVRGILCAACNTYEGVVHHKFERSGLKGRGVDYTTWLRRLADYLEDDYTDNDFHPQHPKDQTKIFGKMRLNEMKEHLTSVGITFPENAKKADLEKIYRKSFLHNPRCDFDNGKYDSGNKAE